MKKGKIILNEKNDEKIDIIRRTNTNYTHMVNIDAKIVSITSWRNSKFKFRLNLITNILTFGVLHIFSLFKPKLYLKIYCKESLPNNSDFFLIEDIYQNFTLCKTIYRKSSKRKSYSNNMPNNDKKFKVSISFIYNSIKYKYDEDKNSFRPVYFNLSRYKNETIVNTFSEGINSLNRYKNKVEKFGQNIVYLKNRLIFENFLKHDLPQCISVFISGGICLICKVTIFGILLISLSIIVISIKIFYRYLKFIKRLENDYSIDGICEYRVKRKYIKENRIRGFCLIKNIDLVPGDVISLSEGEILPCDGVILDGECVLNEAKICGKLDNTIKHALESNNNYFSYENNKNAIVFHGAEILKIYSKDSYKNLIVLVINTGINTFKGNLLSNLLYKKIIRKISRNIFSKFKEKYYLIFLVVLYIASSTGIIIRYLERGKKHSIFDYVVLNLGLILMPIYYIIICFIKHLGIIYLNSDTKESIQCIDESRLIETGKINRIIFDKTGTLTENNNEISAFIPLYYDYSTLKLYFKIYDKKNIKKICDEHLIYYRNYLTKNYINEDNQNMNLKSHGENKNTLIDSFFDKNVDIKNSNICYELSALFLQCLVCCTNLTKINNEICGNLIEKEIINIIKWDINTIELLSENNETTNYNNKESKENIIDKIQKLDNMFLNDLNKNNNNNYNYNSLNIINEVFPKNYYKITEGLKTFQTNKNSYHSQRILRDNNQPKVSQQKSFKLIIINRFFNNSYIDISCIVYNALENNYHFMIKGPPEKVLKHCTNNLIPDINKIMVKSLREGYRVLACATKIIQYNQYDKNQKEEYYMKDLTFCGFIIMNNNLKEESKQIVENIKKMECDISISSGDGVYNNLETGLKCGLFNEKNLFIFDVNAKGKKQKIFVRSINNVIKKEEEENNDISISNMRSIQENLEEINITRKNITEDEDYDITKMKTFDKIKYANNNKNLSNSNDLPSSSRKIIRNYEENNIIKEINKNEENESFSLERIDTSNFDEVNNSPLSNYVNEDINSSSHNKANANIPLKYCGTLLINDLEYKKNDKYLIVNEKEKNKLNTQIIQKRNNIFNDKNNTDLNDFHLDSHYENIQNKDISKKKSETIKYNMNNKFLGILKEKKNVKMPNKLNNHKTNEKINKLNLQNIKGISFSPELTILQPTNKNHYFEYSLDKINYFVEGSTMCFSGMALKHIYDKRKKKEYRVLLKYMNKYGKIFYSMTSYEKSLLIKINKEIFNKKICMVGDGANDIDAIMSSNVGIYMGQQKNLNTLLSHYFIENNSLMNIETIIKNGRGYYENDALLLPANFLFTTCWVGLITYSYYLEKKVDNVMLGLLNLSIFILCVSAFTTKPNHKINMDYLLSNEKLLRYFEITRFIGILLIKIICQIIFYIYYQYNENIEDSKNKEIILNYIFILTWSQSMSSVLVFNMSSFYRKSVLSNIFFLIIYIIFFSYIIYLITLNDIALGKIIIINMSFEFSNINVDFFDDNHKLLILALIIIDIVFPCIFSKILVIVFTRKAFNIKKNVNGKEKKVKVKKEEKEEKEENEEKES